MKFKAKIRAKQNKPTKLKLRKGDAVMIISGKDKGQVGYIEAIDPEKMKAYVLQDNPENPDQPLPLNAAIKHRKARYQGEKSARMQIPVPIHMSNLMYIDAETQTPTRIGRRKEDGKIVRFAKKTDKSIKDLQTYEKKD